MEELCKMCGRNYIGTLMQHSRTFPFRSVIDAEIVLGLCECDVKLEFYYVSHKVLCEPLSYLAIENGLGEENVVLQLQNGCLIWSNICPRERRGN